MPRANAEDFLIVQKGVGICAVAAPHPPQRVDEVRAWQPSNSEN